MNPALIKFTTELYAPGAVISPTLTKWYAKAGDFHSRRTLWPVKEAGELLAIHSDGSEVLEDFLHIRVATMMDGYDGATDGPLDRMFTSDPLHIALANELPRITQVALKLAPPYYNGRTFAAWMELWDVSAGLQFIRQVSVEELAILLTEKGPSI